MVQGNCQNPDGRVPVRECGQTKKASGSYIEHLMEGWPPVCESKQRKKARLLSFLIIYPDGRVAEWLMAADCKSARASVHRFESCPFHHFLFLLKT
jgi:hypothetical protein